MTIYIASGDTEGEALGNDLSWRSPNLPNWELELMEHQFLIVDDKSS